jgi:RNA polymerase sigma factor (sigma-70 family)
MTLTTKPSRRRPPPDGQTGTRYQADAELVQACLDKDETAWHKLVERYGPLVYSIPRRAGLSQADADDVFQNVFLIVYRRLPTLRNHTSLCAWLTRITQRETVNLYRRARDHGELYEDMLGEDASFGEAAETREQRDLVHQALSQLDPRSQALLRAVFLDPDTPSYQEIARRLGVPIGAIGPTRARSLKKLETAVAALAGESLVSRQRELYRPA